MKTARVKWRLPWYCLGCGLKVIYKDEEHVCPDTESVPVATLKALRRCARVLRRLRAAGGGWDVDARYEADQALARLDRVSR